jgi:hypothetical protein
MSLQRSYLLIQPFCGSHAVWYVSYQLLSRSWHTDLDYGSYRLSNVEIGLTAGVTGQQGMLTPPWHLIPPLVFPRVRVSLICFIVDYSITWTGHWFCLRIFPLTWLSVLILTADNSVYLIWTHWFWLLIFTFDIAHGGCDRSAGDACSSMAPDPTSDIFRGPCTPILWFVFPIRLMRLITDRYFCHF